MRIVNYFKRILYVAAVASFFCRASTLASAYEIVACEYHKCTPNCICDLRDPIDCAKSYGNYGWLVPKNTDDYVYHHMRQPDPIEYYEIIPAGMRVESTVGVRLAGEGIGFGKIESIQDESLTGQVYFEIHPDQLRGSDKISVELYGDVGFGLSDCARHGTLLSHATFASIADEIDKWGEPNKVFSSSTFRFNSYNSMFRELNIDCHPRASGAVMAAAEYTIFDPFNQTSIWFPDSETSTKGRLDYCIRISVNKPNIRRLGPPDLSEAKAAAAASKVSDGEEQEGTIEVDKGYKTSFDTKIRIEGDRSKRGFQSDSSDEDKDVVSTHSSQAVESSTDSEDFQKISAFAFSCSDGGKGKYNDYGTVIPPRMEFGDARRRFAVGQVFRVCVSPGEGFEDVYSVVAFESVVCENFGEARTLFQSFKPTDDSMERDNAAFTSSTRDTMSYVNLDTAEIVTASNTLSFRTLVTPDFRKLNETSFVCSGIVSLRYQPSSQFNATNFTLTESELLLQAKQKTIRSDFSISIDLLTPAHVNAKPIEEELRPKKWKLGLILFSIFWIMFLLLLDYSLHGTDNWNYAYEQILGGNFCFCRRDHERDDDDDNRWSHMYHQVLSGNFCCYRRDVDDDDDDDDDNFCSHNCWNTENRWHYYDQVLSLAVVFVIVGRATTTTMIIIVSIIVINMVIAIINSVIINSVIINSVIINSVIITAAIIIMVIVVTVIRNIIMVIVVTVIRNIAIMIVARGIRNVASTNVEKKNEWNKERQLTGVKQSRCNRKWNARTSLLSFLLV